MIHEPVLIKEVLQYLGPKENENFVDCTVGEGGHTALIVERTKPNGKVLGIDLDPDQIENSKKRFEKQERVILVNDSYANLKEILEEKSFENVNGILIDLGMSSFQLEGSTKGFSFQKDEDLDMRYSKEQGLTAKEIINEYDIKELERILEEYGEERYARQIAKKIVEERKNKKIESTFQLVQIIKEAVPKSYQFGNIHLATRTFQALRIATNNELGNLERVLPDAISILSSGGRLVIISFHSLEDRIVKNFFKQKEEEGVVKILTKKPVTADVDEMGINPRSRSAKLRAIVKI